MRKELRKAMISRKVFAHWKRLSSHVKVQRFVWDKVSTYCLGSVLGLLAPVGRSFLLALGRIWLLFDGLYLVLVSWDGSCKIHYFSYNY